MRLKVFLKIAGHGGRTTDHVNPIAAIYYAGRSKVWDRRQEMF